MTTAIWLRDVWMYALQIGLLVSAAALVAALLNDRVSRASLLFWQSLLIVCLGLPLCQTWRPATHTASLAPTLAVADAPAILSAPKPDLASRSVWPVETTVLAALGAGIVLRLVWLVLGLWSLHRLRRGSSPLPDDLEPFRAVRAQLGVEARFYSSAMTPTPVTFGLGHPAVLLPESILTLDVEKQKAIAYHELLHVKRHDWIQLISEECVRAVLWFHPAIWWLLDRIHLNREQVVDQAVIERTESRQHYVEALLAVAALPREARPFPATLFLKKSRLRRRVNELFKETTMSRTRLSLSLGASTLLVLLSAALGVRIFPLEVKAAQDPEPISIQVKDGGPQLVHGERIEYPRLAIKKGVEGIVQIEVTVDEEGRVSDARVLNGPMELRAAALSSALAWHFAPAGNASTTAEATITFRLPAEGSLELKTFQYQGGTVSALVPRQFSTDDGRLSERQRAERDMEKLQLKLKESSLSSEEKTMLKKKLIEATRMLEATHPDREALVASGTVAEKQRLENQLIDAKKMMEMVARERVGFAVVDDHEGFAVVDDRADREKAERQMVERELKQRLEQLQNPELAPADATRLTRQVAELETLMAKLRAENQIRLPGRLVQIRSERVPDDTLKALMSRLSLSVGDTVDSDRMGQVVEQVKAFDEHLRVAFQRAEDGGVVLVIIAP